MLPVGRHGFTRGLGEMRVIVVEAHSAFCEEGTNCITLSSPCCSVLESGHQDTACLQEKLLTFPRGKMAQCPGLGRCPEIIVPWKKAFWVDEGDKHWGAVPGLVCTAPSWPILGPGWEGHNHTDAGLLWDESACYLGQVTPALDMCFLICNTGWLWKPLKFSL